jgi:hypothetical protein
MVAAVSGRLLGMQGAAFGRSMSRVTTYRLEAQRSRRYFPCPVLLPTLSHLAAAERSARLEWAVEE